MRWKPRRARALRPLPRGNRNPRQPCIIDTQINEGLHNDSPISFRDIRDIKDTFISRLATMFHGRIPYPEHKRAEPNRRPLPQPPGSPTIKSNPNPNLSYATPDISVGNHHQRPYCGRLIAH